MLKLNFCPRVLLLEDETLVGLDLSLTLQTDGFEVLGPCRNADEAHHAMKDLYPDIAVLDINLGDNSTSFDMARELQRADIPVVFVSGYTEATVPLPSDLDDAPRLRKPVEPAVLSRLLTDALSAPKA